MNTTYHHLSPLDIIEGPRSMTELLEQLDENRVLSEWDQRKDLLCADPWARESACCDYCEECEDALAAMNLSALGGAPSLPSAAWEGWTSWDLSTSTDAVEFTDTLLGPFDRRDDTLLLQQLDESSRPSGPPVLVARVDLEAPASERASFMSCLVEQVEAPSALLALGSAEPLPDSLVRGWHRTARRVLGHRGCVLEHFLTASIGWVRAEAVEASVPGDSHTLL